MIPKDYSLFSKMLANTFVLARVPQRNRTYKRIYIYTNWFTNIYTHIHTHTQLVHAIMESEKSQALQSTCWRPRKADKVVVLKPGGTRLKKNQCFSLSSKTRKYHLPSSTVKPSYSALLFYSGPQLIRWGPPTLGREFPRWLSGKESACQYRRQGFDPWRRKWQSTPVFLERIPWPEGPGGLLSIGVAKSQIWLSDYAQAQAFYVR